MIADLYAIEAMPVLPSYTLSTASRRILDTAALRLRPEQISAESEISPSRFHMKMGLTQLPFIRPSFRANKSLLTYVSAPHCTPNTRLVTITRKASPASRVAGTGLDIASRYIAVAASADSANRRPSFW
jgi:hypothetical protein